MRRATQPDAHPDGGIAIPNPDQHPDPNGYRIPERDRLADGGLTISGADRVTFIGPFALRDGQPVRRRPQQRDDAVPVGLVFTDAFDYGTGCLPDAYQFADAEQPCDCPIDHTDPGSEYGPDVYHSRPGGWVTESTRGLRVEPGRWRFRTSGRRAYWPSEWPGKRDAGEPRG